MNAEMTPESTALLLLLLLLDLCPLTPPSQPAVSSYYPQAVVLPPAQLLQ
jgi:hypothetical protein